MKKFRWVWNFFFFRGSNSFSSVNFACLVFKHWLMEYRLFIVVFMIFVSFLRLSGTGTTMKGSGFVIKWLRAAYTCSKFKTVFTAQNERKSVEVLLMKIEALERWTFDWESVREAFLHLISQSFGTPQHQTTLLCFQHFLNNLVFNLPIKRVYFCEHCNPFSKCLALSLCQK